MSRCPQNVANHFNGCTCKPTTPRFDPPAGSTPFGSVNDTPAQRGITVWTERHQMTPDVLKRIGATKWQKPGSPLLYFLNDKARPPARPRPADRTRWWENIADLDAQMDRTGKVVSATHRGKPLLGQNLTDFFATSAQGVRFSIPERGGEPVVVGVATETAKWLSLGLCSKITSRHDDW